MQESSTANRKLPKRCDPTVKYKFEPNNYAQICKFWILTMKKHYGCPIKATVNTFAGKWKVLIVWHLSFRALRFGELRKLLPGVTEKVLTAQLRELQSDGILERKSLKSARPNVSYKLTDAGNELIPAMEAMCSWGTKYLGVEPTLPRRQASGKLSQQLQEPAVN